MPALLLVLMALPMRLIEGFERMRSEPAVPPRALERAPWRHFAWRAVLLAGLSVDVVLAIRSHELSMRVPGIQWLALLVVFLGALGYVSAVRYHRFRRADPLSHSYVGKLHRRQLVRDAWNPLVLAAAGVEVEGTLHRGTAFALKMAHRMPWLGPYRVQAMLRLAVDRRRIAARLGERLETLYPPEAREGLEAFLRDVHSNFKPGDLEMVITPERIQIWLQNSPPAPALFAAAGRLLDRWAQVPVPAHTGYRGGRLSPAARDEISRLEQEAEAAWVAFPDRPPEPRG
jgi:hypothetical protein